MSQYLDHLPVIYRQNAFLGRFLLAFQRILSAHIPSVDDTYPPGVEEVLDGIHSYFRPGDSPAEFLTWLADWVAVSLRDDWDESKRRWFIARVVALYRKRGTPQGLADMVSLYTGCVTRVIESSDSASEPHYFNVEIESPSRKLTEVERIQEEAQLVLEREKPAHTYYGLTVLSGLKMRIINRPPDGNTGSFVGRTTVLGGVGTQGNGRIFTGTLQK